MANQAWRVTAVVSIGYWIGNGDEFVPVAMQLFECRAAIDSCLGDVPNQKVELACTQQVQTKLTRRLTSNMENYGIVGLKRWRIKVKSIRVEPDFVKEEESENQDASEVQETGGRVQGNSPAGPRTARAESAAMLSGL